MTQSNAPHIDARLDAAARLVRQGSVAADIGCDHGNLCCLLAKQKKCRAVYAVDIAAEPLRTARENARRCGCEDSIRFVLGDGLNAVQTQQVTDFVVAGVSGVTVCQMLHAAPWARQEQNRFVFIPASRVPQLRAWLWQHGFALLQEELVKAAGRLYTVLYAQYTGRPRAFTYADTLLGGVAEQPYAAEYCAALKKHIQNSLHGADASRERELREALQRLNEVTENAERNTSI